MNHHWRGKRLFAAAVRTAGETKRVRYSGACLHPQDRAYQRPVLRHRRHLRGQRLRELAAAASFRFCWMCMLGPLLAQTFLALQLAVSSISSPSLSRFILDAKMLPMDSFAVRSCFVMQAVISFAGCVGVVPTGDATVVAAFCRKRSSASNRALNVPKSLYSS